jgi:ubiquinone/menaquinone biosynthesis C-methylase UbiE
MTQTGSYDVKNFSTTSEGEIRRLNAQLDLFWEKEYALYTRFGLKDGMKILDCGCGPGYLLEKLLNLLPSSIVCGIELDPLLVAVAADRLNGFIGAGRCSVAENSILSIDYPDNSFDFVVTRLVVEHVPDPLVACRELYRVLKPGGIVVVVDNDFEMHVRTFPGIPELGELYNAYCRARSSEGGNPKIGRELPLLLKKSGFSLVDLDIVNAHSAVIGDGAFLKSEGPGIPAQLVESGYLSDETYKTMISKWHDMLKSDDHAIVRQLYVATGRKLQEQVQKYNTTLNKKIESSGIDVSSGLKGSHEVLFRLKGDEIDDFIDLVKNHVAKIINTSPDTIKDDVALTDIGVDSEAALELQESLTGVLTLKKPLPATLVFDYPTIRAIARFISGSVVSPSTVGSGPASDTLSAGKNGSVQKEEISELEIEKRLREKLDLLDKDGL